jgi:hypothetical protein
VNTGRPQTVQTEHKIQEVAILVCVNYSQLVDNLARAYHDTCYEILTDELKKSHVTQHTVPRILSQDQRDDRMAICSNLISSADDDLTFLNWIVTVDEI